MDSSRCQFLAGPGFALDQHRGVAGRELFEQTQGIKESGRSPDETVRPLPPPKSRRAACASLVVIAIAARTARIRQLRMESSLSRNGVKTSRPLPVPPRKNRDLERQKQPADQTGLLFDQHHAPG